MSIILIEQYQHIPGKILQTKCALLFEHFEETKLQSKHKIEIVLSNNNNTTSVTVMKLLYKHWSRASMKRNVQILLKHVPTELTLIIELTVKAQSKHCVVGIRAPNKFCLYSFKERFLVLNVFLGNVLSKGKTVEHIQN